MFDRKFFAGMRRGGWVSASPGRDCPRLRPPGITEIRERYVAKWAHSYRIDGDDMTFVDGMGRSREVSGHPTVEIESAIRRMQSDKP